MSDLFVRMTAYFSRDQLYRYTLTRDRLHDGAGICNFIMLNPSTADEYENDPTVERCQRRAFAWGFERMVVTNLFAYRSTDPMQLRYTFDPIGPENDRWIVEIAKAATVVCCAWGNHGQFNGRALEVKARLQRHNIALHVLRLNRNGIPCHPLYLPYSEQLKPWD